MDKPIKFLAVSSAIPYFVIKMLTFLAIVCVINLSCHGFPCVM